MLILFLQVFTPVPIGGKSSGVNVAGGNMGPANGNSLSNKDKTKSSQNGSGDMSSSNRPEWSVYLTNTSTKHTTSTGDVNTFLICLVFILLRTSQWVYDGIWVEYTNRWVKTIRFFFKVSSNKLLRKVLYKYNSLFNNSCRMIDWFPLFHHIHQYYNYKRQ